jgi:hypothetical protein
MADNVAITAGAGTNIATDDLAGVQYQRVKVVWGVDGVANDTNATTPLPIKPVAPSTATLTNVASSATNVTLKASNANRQHLTIFNDSTQVLYVKWGATASATSYTVQIAPGGYYEFPQPAYTGIVDGIWAAANGNARVTEA